ncbi:NU5M oxidoreductase, partial [Acromyrmex charruanus]
KFNYLLLLFILSIALTVIRPNIIRVLVGWDDLGVLSYCLVIYYHNYVAPTRVSALVHSSTLITAGVYLTIRFSRFLIETNVKNYCIIDFVPLRLMIIILSFGFRLIAYYHLLVHAIFRSILHMIAVVVIYSIKNTQNIRLLENLNEIILCEIIKLIISSIALRDVPFISGFYRKSIIIDIIYFSNSLYSLMGAVRGISQSLSYEVSLVIIFLVLMILREKYSFIDFLKYAFTFSILIRIMSYLNLRPIDFVEGESELVSGFNYINLIVESIYESTKTNIPIEKLIIAIYIQYVSVNYCYCKLAFSITNILKSFIKRGKDKLELLFFNQNVYKISCDCETSYVGQTKRKLSTRMKILNSESSYNKRLLSEMVHIKIQNMA